MADQAERLRQLSKSAFTLKKSREIKEIEPQNLAHVIAITSGKGGVGKSTFTVNLALALANLGKKVLIIDADLGMANIDVMLGCIAKYSMFDIIEGRKSLEEVVVTGPRGIKFLPGGSGIKSLPVLSNLDLQRVLNQSVQYEQDTDFILLDTGAGMGDHVLSFLMAADDVFLVTTPEPTSLTDAYSIIKSYASNSGNACLRLIINRAANTQESEIVADKLGKVASKFLQVALDNYGCIFDDQNVSLSIRAQTPLLLQFPQAPAAICIENIAYKLVYGSDKVEKKGFSGFFKKFLSIYK